MKMLNDHQILAMLVTTVLGLIVVIAYVVGKADDAQDE